MTRYEEEILRRALHAAADRIEPAPDGLERIRARLSKPRPLAVAWLMVCWTGVAQPALLRMEPAVASLFERLGAWLRLVVKPLGAGVQRVRPPVRRRPRAVKMLRPRPAMARRPTPPTATTFPPATTLPPHAHL